MSVRILESRNSRMAAMYDSCTGWAFGPIFEGDDAAVRARRFLAWLPKDARLYPEAALEVAYHKWLEETSDGV